MSLMPEVDPTMEEILLSVRRMVIVDDEQPSTVEPPVAPTPPNIEVREPKKDQETPRSAAPTTVENLFEKTLRGAFEPALAGYLSDNALSPLASPTPLVEEWLNAHFEAILTGVVRTEVENIIRSRKS